MRKIAVIDAETDPFRHGRVPAPFVWGYFDGIEYREFRETDELAAFIAERDEIIYAHNGGKFDFFFLAPHFNWNTPVMLINERIACVNLGECELRDSFSILPVPLKAHDKGEIDYRLFEADVRDNHRAAISDYLKRDCISLYRLVTRYVEEFGLNLTLARGAMKVWCDMTDRPRPATSAAFYERFAPFYYGGRVEALELGTIERRFTVADINSAFPHAMLERHPYGDEYLLGTKLPSDPSLSFVELDCRSLGAFPVRDEDGGLDFPRDGIRRRFMVTGREYVAAAETNVLRDAEIVSVYTFTDSVSFPEYVQRFYADKAAAKLTGDSAAYLLAKLHLNALYGKFGANPSEYHEYLLGLPSEITARAYDGWMPCEMFGPHMVYARPLPPEKHNYYNVATAASITGAVRARLWRAMCASSGLLYVDTDSIAAARAPFDYGPELGQWSHECECDFAAIAGKKLYAFRRLDGTYKTASKGVRLTAADIIRVTRGETVTHAKDAPTFSLKHPPRFIARDVKMRQNPNTLNPSA